MPISRNNLLTIPGRQNQGATSGTNPTPTYSVTYSLATDDLIGYGSGFTSSNNIINISVDSNLTGNQTVFLEFDGLQDYNFVDGSATANVALDNDGNASFSKTVFLGSNVNSTSAFTVKLRTGDGTIGDVISSKTGNLTIQGSEISITAADSTVSTDTDGYKWVTHTDTSSSATMNITTFNNLTQTTYAVIAGGGGGGLPGTNDGSGGGGGAGGVLTGRLLASSTNGDYTINTGAGGVAVASSPTSPSSQGGNTSVFQEFTGTNANVISGGNTFTTSFLSQGGGHGGSGFGSSTTLPTDGGSGGGAGAADPLSFGTGISGQGNNGARGFRGSFDGAGGSPNNIQMGGGGGGASAVGEYSGSFATPFFGYTNPPNGGAGITLTDTPSGSSESVGGGGGGKTSGVPGGPFSGAGGLGGGGAVGVAGTDGTGGGGGVNADGGDGKLYIKVWPYSAELTLD